MKRKEKGSRGYIDGQKKKFGIMTAAFFILVAAFFITGLVLCKTRNNILTVMAILMVLPGAKFAVDLINLRLPIISSFINTNAFLHLRKKPYMPRRL